MIVTVGSFSIALHSCVQEGPDQVGINDQMDALLGHVVVWGSLDVTFREDAKRLTQGRAGHVMAALNNLVIGLLRRAGFTNLAAARRL